ncbi:endonuclease/exonuclease/phosphatase family protein [Novosphingobium percolationis]|uniref:endonuclease/exonuclease/phosphatase family protein n=1 Tax=Novosphingobium percolationis TaxID=2871811 RepID=UPI001CD5A753|nr:endonuclease/exonuclease/phosphatase family protein [Novosphingobium percolationis]
MASGPGKHLSHIDAFLKSAMMQRTKAFHPYTAAQMAVGSRMKTTIRATAAMLPIVARGAQAAALLLLLASVTGAAAFRADSLQIAAPALVPAAALLALIAGGTAPSPGDRLLGWSWFAAALAWGWALAAPLQSPAPTHLPTPNTPFRMISFNIYRDNAQVHEAVAWILAQKPDAVVLLEAMPLDNSAFLPLTLEFPFVEACAPQLRCSTTIFARHPFAMAWHHAQGDPENRKALSAVTVLVNTGCASVPITAVHLSRPWPLGWQRQELRTLAQVLRTEGRGGVLAGDFNSAPWTFAMRRLARAGQLRLASGARPTWPSGTMGTPLLPLDQIYVGRAIAIRAVSRGPHLGSDHRPMVTDLTIPCER